MSKRELVAVRANGLTWQRFFELLPSLLEPVGVSLDPSGRDGELVVRDFGDNGCALVLDHGSIAQPLSRVLAKQLGESVFAYEVVGTKSMKGFKFRASATEATPDGDLKPAEGVELDFDDPEQTWGGGDLDARSLRVLRDYARLPSLEVQTKTLGLKRRSAAKASSPRVASLLKLLKKAKTWQGVPQEGGRVELRIELAAGGRQMSYCSAAEYEELERLATR